MKRLPFVSERDGKKNWWAVTPADDSAFGAARGREYADELIEYMRDTGNTAALGWVCRQMIINGAYGSIEIGFMQRVADRMVDAQPAISTHAS